MRIYLHIVILNLGGLDYDLTEGDILSVFSQ